MLISPRSRVVFHSVCDISQVTALVLNLCSDTVSPHERLKIAYGQTHAVKGLNETVEVV